MITYTLDHGNIVLTNDEGRTIYLQFDIDELRERLDATDIADPALQQELYDLFEAVESIDVD